MNREDLVVAVLERENAELRERIALLENCLFDTGARYDLLGLTIYEARVFGALMKRPILSKDQIFAIVYSGRGDSELPDGKVVDVYVCKIRAKLKRYGIRVETVWGTGYSIQPGMKGCVSQLLKQLGGEGARAA